jgi:hypothetical protein
MFCAARIAEKSTLEPSVTLVDPKLEMAVEVAAGVIVNTSVAGPTGAV